MLWGAISLFWLAFLTDGVLSLTDALLAGESPALNNLRNTVAFLVLVASVPMAVLLGVTPRAPKRVIIPLILFAWWAGPAMAFPLGSMERAASRAGSGRRSGAICGGGLARFSPRLFKARISGEWTPGILLEVSAGRRSVGCFAFPCLGREFNALGTRHTCRLLTKGYVRVQPDGVYLLERKFQSGDREVRLTGMMHIANREFYSGLLSGVDTAIPSIVLVEGVTDRKRLLGANTLSYERLARSLNLTPQSDSVFSEQVLAGLGGRKSQRMDTAQSNGHTRTEGIDFRHADVDVESFHPQTVAFIVAVIGLFQSADFRQLLTKLVDPSSPITNESAQAQIMEDILSARNRRLSSEIESSLKEYRRVIVPWGAMHLPEIETWLEEHEFVMKDETRRKALSFW